jgi:hypothetical protein
LCMRPICLSTGRPVYRFGNLCKTFGVKDLCVLSCIAAWDRRAPPPTPFLAVDVLVVVDPAFCVAPKFVHRQTSWACHSSHMFPIVSTSISKSALRTLRCRKPTRLCAV